LIGKANDLKPPQRLELIPVSRRCNLDCVYCWRQFQEEEENKISNDEYLDLIDQAGAMGVKEIEITGGGEPVLSDAFTALVRKIKSENMKGMLVTNGTLLNRKIVEILVSLRWDQVSISLDGAKQETQDELRGKTSYKKSLSAINYLKKFKEFLGGFKLFFDDLKYHLKRKNLYKAITDLDKHDKQLKTVKPRVFINTVLNRKNYREIPEFFELANEFSVFGVYFQPLIVHDSSLLQYKIRQEDQDQLVDRIEEGEILANKYDIKTNLDCFKPDEGEGNPQQEGSRQETPFCSRPWTHLRIFPAGRTASPCPSGGNYEENITNPLKEIWQSNKIEQLREKLLKGEIPEQCRDCCEADA